MKCPYCDLMLKGMIDFGMHMAEHPDKLSKEQLRALNVASKLLGELK